MPTVYSARLDGSDAIRHNHVSLVAFYLRQARSHAVAAVPKVDFDERFASSLLSIVLSALCLEAFSNEMAENTLPDAEIQDFLAFRRSYRKPRGMTGGAWKLIRLFELKWEVKLSIEDTIIGEIEEIFRVRNQLVHYKLSETAERVHLPPPVQLTADETGVVMTVFDFTLQPTHVEPSLVERITPNLAACLYNSAVRVLRLWNEKANAPANALSAHAELPES